MQDRSNSEPSFDDHCNHDVPFLSWDVRNRSAASNGRIYPMPEAMDIDCAAKAIKSTRARAWDTVPHAGYHENVIVSLTDRFPSG